MKNAPEYVFEEFDTSESLTEGYTAHDETLVDLSQIREASKSWTPSQWEAYLSSTETQQREQTFDFLTEGLVANTISPFNTSTAKAPRESKEQVRQLLTCLTEKQRFVIEKIFFERMSRTQVAKMMGISRQGVFDLKRRAIRKLKNNARELLVTFPLVRVQRNDPKSSPAKDQSGEEAKDVEC